MPPVNASNARTSAGILLYRRAGVAGRGRDGQLEVLLVHPGGPFWARRDQGAWSIPKGEYEPGDDALEAARREFAEELGSPPPDVEPLDLGEVRQKSGKLVHAWAVEGDIDPSTTHSNTFTLEWPPRSGRTREYPEVDRVEWFTLDAAREKLNQAQTAFLDRLAEAGV
jgi:predicted NUDIX family NTP pyrophosphohydrolase